ncbi:transcriptional regulator, Crp/Fnr family [Arcticibacter svalbardensis MN12-7]|uniref:Transcriptional regulator, Crp/Fnr family n=1 Tax=Arcticibacter svalbardensis MN12-7 TaxID=1150600 RepID=R9GU14_9SPHI|nr:response regulator [Arcticibacter svalbardensis]EOR95148.1 transcriptional regulator, Crp/Fnr family [Arcticibacter svalbardensis MN12-7]
MKKTSILIIEDNDDIRESTTEILELANYTVFHANNGKTGVELAVKHLPDIILCDIMMPELDGYGVLFMLNKTPETSTIPFIFLTAKAERIDMRKGMEMGADDYLTKPFDDVELLNAIESRLNKRDKQEAFYNKSLEKLDNLVGRGDGLAELQKLVADRKIRTVKKKQVIYYEGDSPSGLYLILNGKVKTFKLSNDGRELLTSIYGPDEYIGVNALLSNDVYHETSEAVEDTSICMLPKEMIDQLVNHYPQVGRAFIKILSNNLKEKEDQLLQLAYHSVRKRMAQVLLRLAGTDPEKGVLRISRDDLAAMAGMATETVSRTLSDFKDEGLIEKKGSQIIILNATKLINMKN